MVDRRGLTFRADPDGDQFYALTTFRRDGSAVSTPIWLAPADGRWYAYTPARSGKVRRIARSAQVEVVPSDFHGEPIGERQHGRARILPATQLSTARRALVAKYGMKFRLFAFIMVVSRRRRRGGRAVGLEIILDGDDHEAAVADVTAR